MKNVINGRFIPSTRREADEGVSMVLVAIFIVVMLQFAAFGVDLSLGFAEKRRIHIGTDAAALAAVMKYKDFPATVNSLTSANAIVAPEAVTIGIANGLTAEELAAGGGIVPGQWNPATRVFTPNLTPLNAVQVSARRSVPTFFGRLMNVFSLNPAVTSIARIGGASEATCMVPYAIDDNVLEGMRYGDTIDIKRFSPGNWGKIDVGDPANGIDDNMSSAPNFEEAMRRGLCGVKLSIGALVEPGTGFAGLEDGFRDRMAINPVVILPVVNHFGNGNSELSTIVGFVVVEIVRQGRRGANWSGNVRLLDETVGSGASGPLGPPYASARVLVQ